ncbi:MAG TPA: DUF59 domain-containing protein [Thermoanaerobaculia bacterium]|nr:DUF59 domain-containing protein [Thermoanaerobaculia bacterium]
MFGRFRRQEPDAGAAATADADASSAAAPPAVEVGETWEPASSGSDAAGDRSLEERVVEALQSIYDPEIPVNIYELGLIYDVALPEGDEGRVGIKMTLTSPHCPVAESLPGDVKRRVEAVVGVAEADVEVVWDPAWNPEMMSEAAKLELGFF